MKKTLRFLLMATKFLCYGLALTLWMLGPAMANSGSAQIKSIDNVKVKISFDHGSLQRLFKEIEGQTEFKFLVSDQSLDKKTQITLGKKEGTVADILYQTVEQTKLSFKQVNQTISVGRSASQDSESVTSEIMDIVIRGKVTSADEPEGIPFLTVIVKGTTSGTVTEADGNYVIQVPDESAVLVFSAIGYETQEIVVGNQTQINVLMEEEVSALNEVVVVGFGRKDREDITGAVSSAKMDKIIGDRPVNDAAKALQGTIPGLQITYGSGQPGIGTSLNIRGFESINGGTPLVLVDNIPMSLDDVNPRDIEDVAVLKDASAASIYGAEAAFGVILITTKTGVRNQPVRVDYSNNFGFTRPSTLPQKASPLEFVTALSDWGQQTYWTGQNIQEWIGYIEQYNANPSQYPDGYITDPNGLRYYAKENDQVGDFLGDAGFEQIHNLSLSGGSDKTTYRVSFGYNDENGIMITNKDRYTRYNGNMNINTQITPKLNATFNILYKNGLRTGPMGGNWGNLYYVALTHHSATPIGYETMENGEVIPFGTPANMIRYSPVRENFDENIRFFNKLTYNLTEELELNGEFSYEKTNWSANAPNYTPTFINPANLNPEIYQPSQSSYFTSAYKRNYQALNIYGKYNKVVGKNKLNLMLGMNQQQSVYQGFSTTRNELISPDTPGLSTATGNISVNDTYTDYGIVGFFGRIDYQFDEKYLLEVNGRYDGSSRFPKGSQFGFFPSVAGAWKVHREGFLRDTELITNLKLRASWGEIGNQAIEDTWGNYPYLPLMSSGNVSWINNDTGQLAVSLSPPSLVSASFTWERVRTTNIGFDLGILDNRLYTTFDWYTRMTLDMLAAGAQLPNVLGATPPLQNVADLKTQGWELDIKWRDQVGKVSYNIGFNLYDSQTEITEFDNEEGLLSQYYVGRNIGEIWGYVTEGYYTVDDFASGSLDANLMNGELLDGIPAFRGRNPNPGDIRYADLNGDGEIFNGINTLDDPGDRKIIGNSTRRFEYGLNGGLSVGNFDFNFLIRGIGKRDLWIDNGVRFPYVGQFNGVFKHQLDYWTPENTDAYFPRNYPDAGVNYGVNRNVQTKYLANGAYLRIQNITMGYSLKPHWAEKLRVFLSGENLFNFDHLPDGLDAELQGVNQGGNYPFIKKLSVGLNVTF